jgi:hypothetical protein
MMSCSYGTWIYLRLFTHIARDRTSRFQIPDRKKHDAEVHNNNIVGNTLRKKQSNASVSIRLLLLLPSDTSIHKIVCNKMFRIKQDSQLGQTISLMMLMTHFRIILSTRVCSSFVCTSSQTTRMIKSFPTILFEKDAIKIQSDDLQNEEDWEWDGVPIEGAHDSEFEVGSGSNDDFFVPSATFMSMASSVTSPALSVIGTGSSSSNFDQSKNAGALHLTKSEDDFDLEEIGGDPGFLDEEEETEIDTEFGKIKFNKSMDDDLFWEVDEDAHHDFD